MIRLLLAACLSILIAGIIRPNSYVTDAQLFTPTRRPTTASPTNRPTTASPTIRPTTKRPTANPTTRKPTASPTVVVYNEWVSCNPFNYPGCVSLLYYITISFSFVFCCCLIKSRSLSMTFYQFFLEKSY